MLLIFLKMIGWTTNNNHPNFIDKFSAMDDFVKLFSEGCILSVTIDGRYLWRLYLYR